MTLCDRSPPHLASPEMKPSDYVHILPAGPGHLNPTPSQASLEPDNLQIHQLQILKKTQTAFNSGEFPCLTVDV